MLSLRRLALSSTSRSPLGFGQLRHASSCSNTSSPTSPHLTSTHQPDNTAFWTRMDDLPVNEFANLAFFSMDRPLLDLYNEDRSKWEHNNNWVPSAYQPYHPPPTPDTHHQHSSSSNDPESTTGTMDSASTSTTTTLTLNISRINGQLQVVSSEVLGQEQVADYLVAMQQRWEQQQRKRSLARKRYLLRKKGFFEKN